MLAVSADEEAEVWGKTVQTITAEQMWFVLNAAVDILPHNANLQLWRKKESDTCPLCGERQALIHNYVELLQSGLGTTSIMILFLG